MTLLNTLTNLGGNWPSTLALWCVDPLTVKECQGATNSTLSAMDNSCSSPEDTAQCTESGGVCATQVSDYCLDTETSPVPSALSVTRATSTSKPDSRNLT